MRHVVPDRDHQPPTGAQHAPHLSQRRRAVLEEHQAELAGHRVKGRIVEGQAFGAAFTPLDPGSGAACHCEHAGVAVEPDHPALRAGAMRQRASQRAGAAGDVEHGSRRRDMGRLGGGCGELAEERRHEEILVDLGGRGRDLAGRGVVHGVPPLLRCRVTGYARA